MTTLCARHFWVATLGLALLGWTSVVSAAPAPSSLLTNAEVEQTIGKLMGVPMADKEGDASWCNYGICGRQRCHGHMRLFGDGVQHTCETLGI